MSEIEHGGAGSSYTNRKCRCSECRAAHSKRTAERRRKRKGQPVPPDQKHGLYAYTDWWCRCVVCREAKAAYNAAWRARQ